MSASIQCASQSSCFECHSAFCNWRYSPLFSVECVFPEVWVSVKYIYIYVSCTKYQVRIVPLVEFHVWRGFLDVLWRLHVRLFPFWLRYPWQPLVLSYFTKYIVRNSFTASPGVSCCFRKLRLGLSAWARRAFVRMLLQATRFCDWKIKANSLIQ